jgi:hypothetical protein
MSVPRPNSFSLSHFLAILVMFLLALFFAGSPSPSVSAAQSPDSSYFAVTPSAATISLGEEASFSAIDSSGRPVSNVQWSINPPLADVRVENGEGTITAKQSGRVTITAKAGSKTASASLSILPGTTLPAATVKWSVEPLPGFATLEVRQAVPNSDPEVVFYSIEWSKSSNAIVRAFRDSGQQVWMSQLSSTASPVTLKQQLPPAGVLLWNQRVINTFRELFPDDDLHFPPNSSAEPSTFGLPADGKSILLRDSGDDSGGLLLLERGRFRDSLVDLSHSDGSEAWRYHSEGRLSKNWTVNHSGDVALVETLNQPPYSALLVLDGKNGTVRLKVPFPDSSTTINGFRCKDPMYNVLKNIRQSLSGSVFTSTDHNMYIQVETHIESTDNENCKPKQYSFDDSLALLRVTPDGQSEWKTFQHVHADGDGGFHVQPRLAAGESIPDGFGGVLAAWTYIDPHSKPGEPLHTEARLTRISDSTQRDFILPMPYWTPGINSFFAENMILGEGNPLYATNGTLLVRFDTEVGEVNWVRNPPTGSIKLGHSTRGGGLLLANAGRLHYFDAKGNGLDILWTVAVSNPEDIGLVQSDPFDGTPLGPLQLRDVQLTWAGGNLIAVEDGSPYGHGSLLMFIGR